MTVLYLSFGADDYHLQTAHSIRSLRHRGYRGAIRVHTDRADWFTARPRLMRHGLSLSAVSAAEIAAACSDGYIYQYKLVLLLQLIDAHPSGLLFTDSDTVFLRDPTPLFERIAAGQPVVYEDEGALADGGRDLKDYYERHQADFAALWPRTMRLYNSGLIGVGPRDRAWLKETLALCESLKRADAKVHTFEQIALSVALHQAGITPYDGFAFINHYYLFKSRMLKALRLMDATGVHLPRLAPEKLRYWQVLRGNEYLCSEKARRTPLLRLAVRAGVVRFAQLAAWRRRQVEAGAA